jgi:hypothetical protein
MAGALTFRIRIHEGLVFLLADTVFLLLAAAAAALRLASG